MNQLKSALFLACALLLAVPALAHEPGDNTGEDGMDGPSNMFSREIVVPAAGRGPGAHGSVWLTDAWLRGEEGERVTLDFHGVDSPSAAPTATGDVVLDRPVVYIHDVLETLFGLESGLGNIVVRSDHDVSVTIRTYNNSGDGNYGSAFMGMPSMMGMSARSGMMDEMELHRVYVLGLLPQPEARVNVMVANASDQIIRGTVEVVDADGGTPETGPRSFRFEIQPFSSHQFGNVLAGVHSRFGTDAGLQLRAELDEGGSGRLIVLASVVDNQTNDGYTVMGNMMYEDQSDHGGGRGMN